jgi:hypothetical protein
MNHVEALKVARDALEVIAILGEGDGYAARKALAATAVIEPVAASIRNDGKFDTLMLRYRLAVGQPGVEELEVYDAIELHIDAHCAVQVVQALATKPVMTDAEIESLVDWLGDTEAPYFARIAFARALFAAPPKPLDAARKPTALACK